MKTSNFKLQNFKKQHRKTTKEVEERKKNY